ncbi:MAG: hypothetical protein LBI03_01025, partial [Clostridiales bacterium]|nr:hypothetical protein [Clostridiales bacterium]
MNKLRILILLIVAVVILSTTVIYGADPGPVLNFNDEAEIEEIALPEHDCTADWEDGIYTVVSTNESGDGDPYIAYTMDIDADTYTWAKFRIKNLSDCTTFEFHFNPNNTGIAASSKVHFTMTANDTDWKEYVVNIPEANVETVNYLVDISTGLPSDPPGKIDESLWTGDVDNFRFDFMWY